MINSPNQNVLLWQFLSMYTLSPYLLEKLSRENSVVKHIRQAGEGPAHEYRKWSRIGTQKVGIQTHGLIHSIHETKNHAFMDQQCIQSACFLALPKQNSLRILELSSEFWTHYGSTPAEWW